jgi:ParB-like chromosome segregation protein Spo0J
VAKPEHAAALIRSRIVGHGDVKPEDLLANPLNFRRHPGTQMDALRGSMKELGWLKTIIVNKTTGHVLDGHARVEEAMRQGLPTIPATVVELSEDEERLALAVLDPITELAIKDQEMLDELIEQVNVQDAALREMLLNMQLNEEDGGNGGAEVLLEQSVQLKPGREFVVIVAEPGEEWDQLRAKLDLPMVRRGGYAPGSAFDAVSVKRVIPASEIMERLQ